MHVLIIGGGKVGRALAERLEDRDEDVVIIENDPEQVETARNEGFTVRKGDGTDTEVLADAGASRAKTIAAATGDDDSNLLVAQLADSKFDTSRVLARANNPENTDAFEDLGVETISSPMSTAWAMDNRIERPALSKWMTQIGENGDVQEVEVTSESFAGKTIEEVSEKIPAGCMVALVSRDGESTVPDGDYPIQMGDHVTFLGQKDAVRQAISDCHPHD